MPITRRPWNADDVAKLRQLAGKLTPKQISDEIGRTEGAVVVEASKLKLSLRTGRRTGRPQASMRQRHRRGLPEKGSVMRPSAARGGGTWLVSEGLLC